MIVGIQPILVNEARTPLAADVRQDGLGKAYFSDGLPGSPSPALSLAVVIFGHERGQRP